jgi:hypothetical protein
MQAVTQLCDEALLLSQGSCMAKGPVDEVVKAYVEQNRDDSQELGHLEYEMPHSSNGAWIKSLNVGSREHPKLHFDIMESIQLEIEVEVQEDFEDLQMVMHLSSPEGMTFLSSREPDHHNSQHASASRILSVATNKGRYVIKTQLPAPLLNTGFFELHFALVGHHSVVIDEKKNIQVEIHDHHSSFSSCVNHKRASGEFVLPLPWNRVIL